MQSVRCRMWRSPVCSTIRASSLRAMRSLPFPASVSMATSSCPPPSATAPRPSLASAAPPTDWKRDGPACRTAAALWRWRRCVLTGVRTVTSASQLSPGRTARPRRCICSMHCSGRSARPRPCWARLSSTSAIGPQSRSTRRPSRWISSDRSRNCARLVAATPPSRPLRTPLLSRASTESSSIRRSLPTSPGNISTSTETWSPTLPRRGACS